MLMISIVVQSNGIRLCAMHWDKLCNYWESIAYDNRNYERHWDCTAYHKHSCAMR